MSAPPVDPSAGRTRTRRWLTAVVLVVAVVGAVVIERTDDPDASGQRMVSRTMADSLLPYLGIVPFGGVADLRDLDRPDDGVRAFFGEQDAVYRVVDASPDEATLAVWQRDDVGSPPFDEDKAVGTGCVTLRRDAGAVRADVVDCPDHLGPRPDAESVSWGRDAEALAAVDRLGIGAVTAEVGWLMTHESDGYPRRTPRTAAQVLSAIRAMSLPPDTSLAVVPPPDAGDGHVRARLTATASAADPVDTRRTRTAQGCFGLDVVLADRQPNQVVTSTPCA